MSSLSKSSIALLLTGIACLVVVPVHAAPPKATGEAAQKVSMLGGKFTFTLPKGFMATPLPVGDAAQGTAGATGTMYSNATSKTVVITAENTLADGTHVKDNDGAFLDKAMTEFVAQQAKALPDAKMLSEKRLTQKGTGLGLRQIVSSATQGGGPTLDTTLLGARGSRMALVQIISRASDKKGHEVLVEQIVDGR